MRRLGSKLREFVRGPAKGLIPCVLLSALVAGAAAASPFDRPDAEARRPDARAGVEQGADADETGGVGTAKPDLEGEDGAGEVPGRDPSGAPIRPTAGRPDDPGTQGDTHTPDDPGTQGDEHTPDDPGAQGDEHTPDDPGTQAGDHPAAPGDDRRP